MNPLSLIFGGVTEALARWQRHRSEEKEAQHERKMAVIKGDQQYDTMALQTSGWADEYMILIFTSPFIMNVLGSFELAFWASDKFFQASRMFFAELDNVPEYYWYIIGGMLIAKFGLKDIFRGMAHKIMPSIPGGK